MNSMDEINPALPDPVVEPQPVPEPAQQIAPEPALQSVPEPAPQIAPPMAPRPARWMTLLQLIFSLVAAFSLFSLAVLLAALGFSGLVNHASLRDSVTPYFMFATGLALCGLLVLPSAFFALLVLLDRPVPGFLRPSGRFWRILIWILVLVVLPASLGLGWLAAKSQAVSWLILPFLNVFAIGIPILWFAAIGLRGLEAGSSQRLWGLFGAGVAFGPALIMVVEGLVVLVLVFVVIIYVASQPALQQDLSQLVNNLRSSSLSQEQVLQVLQPYVTNPLLIFSVLAFFSICVPLIEETLKPAGMAFLIGRSFTPAQGFIAGVLSGAGYALSESILRISSDTDWLSIVVARTGTGAVHILATGLVGLGLAYAWGQGRYIRLGLLLVAAMSIHGLWNALSLLTAVQVLVPAGQDTSGLVRFLGAASPYALILMTFVCIGLIYWINLQLRKSKPIGEIHGVVDKTV